MVNKVLMSGSYVLVDSMGSESKVVLMDDGTIFGFPGISRYEVLTDFVTEQDSAPDQIFFTGRDNNQPRYGFNFVADTINLFEPPKDYLDTLFTPGPTIYKFIKQH
jgi:hypothetical protein